MRKLSLDNTWDYTKQMWKWIAFQKEVMEIEGTVSELKEAWLEENAPEFLGMTSNCFFCYSHDSSCEETCPGSLVAGSWSCCDSTHNYYAKPGAFYREILRLDAIRTAEPVVVEPTFEVGDVFYRDIECDSGHYVLLKVKDGKVGLSNFLGELFTPAYDNSMNGFRKVGNLNAITFTEVQSMTDYPAGLRFVPSRMLRITETD